MACVGFSHDGGKLAAVAAGNDHLLRVWLAPEAGWRAAEAPALVATEKVVQGGEPWQVAKHYNPYRSQ